MKQLKNPLTFHNNYEIKGNMMKYQEIETGNIRKYTNN